MRAVSTWLFLALVSSAAAEETVCPSKPEIRKKVFVPSAARRHGEVRLAVIPSCSPGCTSAMVCVETVLFTRELSRGIRRIRDEEEDLWPEGSAHRDDSRRYLNALDDAMKALRADSPTARPEDPVPVEIARRDLLLRFERGPSAGRVQIARVEVEGIDGDGPVRIIAARPLSSVSVSPLYVEKSMPRMLARAFDTDDSEAKGWVDDALSVSGVVKAAPVGALPATKP